MVIGFRLTDGGNSKPKPSLADSFRRSTAPPPPPSIARPKAPTQPVGTGVLLKYGNNPAPSGGSGAGSGGGGNFSQPISYSSPIPEAAPAPAPKPISDDDYLASGADPSYTAQLAALVKALENYDSDVSAQRSKYDTDFGLTLSNLGFTPDDPATKGIDESMWNFQDTNTAAGRAKSNQMNDFASRGMLQSSLFATAGDDLTRSLNDQLSGINTGRQNFRDDIGRQRTAFADENSFARQQAKAEAIARRAGQIAV